MPAHAHIYTGSHPFCWLQPLARAPKACKHTHYRPQLLPEDDDDEEEVELVELLLFFFL